MCRTKSVLRDIFCVHLRTCSSYQSIELGVLSTSFVFSSMLRLTFPYSPDHVVGPILILDVNCGAVSDHEERYSSIDPSSVLK